MKADERRFRITCSDTMAVYRRHNEPCCIPCLLILLAAGVSLSAQQPSASPAQPVALFSQNVLNSFAPAGNPSTDAKAKLGDMIFDEKRVSADDSVACNTCHSPRNGFTTHTEPHGASATRSGSATLLRF